jgi:hypothetical protein
VGTVRAKVEQPMFGKETTTWNFNLDMSNFDYNSDTVSGFKGKCLSLCQSLQLCVVSGLLLITIINRNSKKVLRDQRLSYCIVRNGTSGYKTTSLSSLLLSPSLVGFGFFKPKKFSPPGVSCVLGTAVASWAARLLRQEQVA